MGGYTPGGCLYPHRVGGYTPMRGWLYPLIVGVYTPQLALDADFHGDHESGLRCGCSHNKLFRAFAMFRPLHMVVRVFTAKWV